MQTLDQLIKQFGGRLWEDADHAVFPDRQHKDGFVRALEAMPDSERATLLRALEATQRPPPMMVEVLAIIII